MTSKNQEGGHTPGPWRVYPAGTCVPHYDVCDRVVADYPSGRSASEGPSDADAALIAAAPDLLAACELALAHHQGGHSKVGKALRAAIAKARASLPQPPRGGAE